MKHSISGAILGAALATSSPQASSQHAELMTDTRREYTELMDGHPSNITVGAGTSQYGTGIHLEATHGTNHMIFGVRAEVYEDAKRALGALGFRFTESVDGVITVGYTSVNADKALQDDRFSGKLRASSIGASVFYHTDIATAFLRFIQENGKNTNNLYEASSSTTEITTSEFATFIRETMIRTTTHEMYSWEGIERRRATIGGIIPLGDNQEISIEAGASKDPLRGTKAYTRTEYTLYGWPYEVSINGEAGEVRRFGVNGEYQVSPHIGLVGGIEHFPKQHGMPSDTLVHAGVRVYFDPVDPNTRHRRSTRGRQTLEGLVQSELNNSSNIPDPVSLGRLNVTKQTNVEQTDTDTLKPAEGVRWLEYEIHANGVVAFHFTPRAGWEYEYRLDGGAASIPWTPITGSTFQTWPLTPGEYTLTAREMNPLDRTLTADTQLTFRISADSATVISENTVTVGINTASIRLSLFDADGIENYMCQLADAQGNRIGNAFAPMGETCEMSGLTPLTSYTIIETARVARVNPNGSIEWEQVEKRTPFTTLEAPDTTPPTIELQGSSSVILMVGDNWTEPGYRCHDDRDGECTNHVAVTGSVDTNIPGIYTITYTYTDRGGNTATRTRTVHVVAQPILNTPVSVSEPTCDRTVFEVGDVTENFCSLIASDPDGEVQVSALVWGQNVPVSRVNNTYRIGLHTLGLQPGNHMITFTVRGKNPDNTPETPIVKTLSVTVEQLADVPGQASIVGPDSVNTFPYSLYLNGVDQNGIQSWQLRLQAVDIFTGQVLDQIVATWGADPQNPQQIDTYETQRSEGETFAFGMTMNFTLIITDRNGNTTVSAPKSILIEP